MSLYGYYIQEAYNEYILNEEIVLEFNIGDSVKTMIEKVKVAIVKAIDKCNAALDKCKDSKLKEGLKSLLKKFKDLLTKTKAERIEEREVSKIAKEAEKYVSELECLWKLTTSRVYVDELDAKEMHYFANQMLKNNNVENIFFADSKGILKMRNHELKRKNKPLIDFDNEYVKKFLNNANQCIMVGMLKDEDSSYDHPIKIIAYGKMTDELREYINKSDGEVIIKR